MFMKELEEIEEIAKGMREILERILLDSIKTTETSGVCLYGAILLSNAINQFAEAKAIVCGGGPEENCGIIDKNGDKKGHYWVEGTTNNGVHFIADITSDQFEYPKVVVLNEDQGGNRYFPGHHETIQQHVKQEIKSCMQSGKKYNR
jgi:hypothetical protein